MMQSKKPVPDGRDEVLEACQAVFEKRRDDRILAAYVYGSFLGSRHRSDSDLDVAVLDHEDQRLDWSSQGQLMDALERATRNPVDLRMLREGNLSYQTHVVSTGLRIWTSDETAVNTYVDGILRSHERRRDHEESEWADLIHLLAGRRT